MTNEEMMLELQKNGYVVKKIDMNKKNSIKFTREITWYWDRELAHRGIFPNYPWSEFEKLSNYARKIRINLGYKRFDSIPEEKIEEVKENIKRTGLKELLDNYEKYEFHKYPR